jgi:hypothetical protein
MAKGFAVVAANPRGSSGRDSTSSRDLRRLGQQGCRGRADAVVMLFGWVSPTRPGWNQRSRYGSI